MVKRLTQTDQSGQKIVNLGRGTASTDAASVVQLPYVSETAPASPQEGDVWIDTSVVPNPNDGTVLAEYAYPNNPPTPTNGIKLFSRLRAGRKSLSYRRSTTINVAMQDSLFANSIGWLAVAGYGSTAVVQNGINLATVGTATARTFATTSYITQTKRVGYVSAATAPSYSVVRSNTACVWRGNAAKMGGFLVVMRFGLSTLAAGMRAFVGVSGTAGTLANADPTSLFNLVGMALNTADSNWRVINNDGSGTATNADLGSNFAKNTTDMYEVRIFCEPNDTKIGISIENLTTGQLVDYSFTTDIPANTQTLVPMIWVTNNATAAAVAVDVNTLYIETDY